MIARLARDGSAAGCSQWRALGNASLCCERSRRYTRSRSEPSPVFAYTGPLPAAKPDRHAPQLARQLAQWHDVSLIDRLSAALAERAVLSKAKVQL